MSQAEARPSHYFPLEQEILEKYPAMQGAIALEMLDLGQAVYNIYRVIFLTGPPLKISLDWPPPNLLGLAPPLNFLSV